MKRIRDLTVQLSRAEEPEVIAAIAQQLQLIISECIQASIVIEPRSEKRPPTSRAA